MIRFLIRHKYGVLGTLLLHFLVLFFSTKWYMPSANKDFEQHLELRFDTEEPEPLIAEQKNQEQEFTESDDASNKAVNEAAPDVKSGDYNAYNQNTKSAIDEQIEQELKALEQEVIDSQRDLGYGYTEEEAQELLDEKRNKSLDKVAEQKPRSDAAYKGNTNITYKLANRYDVFLKVPVYLCQYGGVVVVNIAVNNTGRVISAKIDRESSSTADDCLTKAALMGAKQTTFNSINTSGVQQGSITYRFITQ
jgi:TonB family protein